MSQFCCPKSPPKNYTIIPFVNAHLWPIHDIDVLYYDFKRTYRNHNRELMTGICHIRWISRVLKRIKKALIELTMGQEVTIAFNIGFISHGMAYIQNELTYLFCTLVRPNRGILPVRLFNMPLEEPESTSQDDNEQKGEEGEKDDDDEKNECGKASEKDLEKFNWAMAIDIVNSLRKQTEATTTLKKVNVRRSQRMRAPTDRDRAKMLKDVTDLCKKKSLIWCTESIEGLRILLKNILIFMKDIVRAKFKGVITYEDNDTTRRIIALVLEEERRLEDYLKGAQEKCAAARERVASRKRGRQSTASQQNPIEEPANKRPRGENQANSSDSNTNKEDVDNSRCASNDHALTNP